MRKETPAPTQLDIYCQHVHTPLKLRVLMQRVINYAPLAKSREQFTARCQRMHKWYREGFSWDCVTRVSLSDIQSWRPRDMGNCTPSTPWARLEYDWESDKVVFHLRNNSCPFAPGEYKSMMVACEQAMLATLWFAAQEGDDEEPWKTK